MSICTEVTKSLNKAYEDDNQIPFEKWGRGRPTKEMKKRRLAFQKQFKENSTFLKYLLTLDK